MFWLNIIMNFNAISGSNSMSKRAFQILLFVALIVCASTVSMSNQVVTDFKIGFMIDKVYLKWKSTIEDNVKEYIVERSHDKFSYNTVGKVKPKGSHRAIICLLTRISLKLQHGHSITAQK